MRARVAVVIAAIAVITLTLTLPVYASRNRAVRVRPVLPLHVPACTEVRGLANVYFSLDGGQTFSGNAEPKSLISAWGIAAFEDAPNVLVASIGSSIYDSIDAGCNWTLRHTFTDQIKHTLHAVAATGGRAYVWAEEFAFRYDHGTVTRVPIPEPLGGLGVDPANRDHVRVFSVASGSLFESFDGGQTWKTIGTSAGGFVTASAFDPTNFDRIVAGGASFGLVVSTDGGKSWTASPDIARTHVCNIAITRGSPNVVWATLGVQSSRDFVFRSTNGGSRFQPLPATIAIENNVCLPLTAHPTDTNRAALTYRALHWIDAATRTTTRAECCDAGIASISYSPVDSNIIYVIAPQR